MQTTEALKRRIETTRDLESVVRTMKALSGATIRQYEKAVEALADYYRTVEMGLHVALRDYDLPPAPPARHERIGAIVLGSDQGLCGRFNEIVTDYAIAAINRFPARGAERKMLAVGARVSARLEALGQPVEECFIVPGSVNAITLTVEQILLKIDEWRFQHQVDDVLLFHNAPAPGALHRPRKLRLLPVDLSYFRYLEEKPWPSRSLPTFTMARKDLLSALLRQYFFVILFRACAESLACEHASRLAAMQRASKNIDEHLRELNGQYQQQRQASITEELLDIVAGYEALTGGAIAE